MSGRNNDTGGYHYKSTTYLEGAFYRGSSTVAGASWERGFGDTYGLGFNARYSNSIYSSSSTVQPLSIRVMYFIKY